MKKMSDDDWGVLDHKALGTITLTLSSPVVFKITKNEGLQSIYRLTSQLETVEIIFADENRALLILSKFPESWEDPVVALSDSSSTSMLRFDDVACIEKAKSTSDGEFVV